MPVLIAIVVIAFVTGLFAKPVTARAVAIGLALLLNFVFVWAIADGKGNDEPSVLVISLLGGAVAIGAAHLAGRMRRTA